MCQLCCCFPPSSLKLSPRFQLTPFPCRTQVGCDSPPKTHHTSHYICVTHVWGMAPSVWPAVFRPRLGKITVTWQGDSNVSELRLPFLTFFERALFYRTAIASMHCWYAKDRFCEDVHHAHWLQTHKMRPSTSSRKMLWRPENLYLLCTLHICTQK